MVAEIERRLAARPDDGAGWSVVAPVYLQMGEAEKAVHAFGNALRLTAPTAQKHAGLGEALVQAADGRVTEQAQTEFRSALALDPSWTPARFYMALALSQQGRTAEAADAWSELLRTGPADGPWRPIAEAALADARGVSKQGLGPTQANVDAAAELSEDDRGRMVEGMVSGLADRLKASPQDVDGWKQLMRSYVVLNDSARATAALAEAEAAFPSGSPERMDIVRFARTLGIADDTRDP
ncbi:hypothetical protein [Aureimonas sp. ME7]|uniref:tetratricopeptide repeat protein n=1 Tax=Aureimonas sp. ME7 TaxID=2744252 RepID=UPI001FCE3555|nr:hypothetical protein [Aureimonas sp. ME7]